MKVSLTSGKNSDQKHDHLQNQEQGLSALQKCTDQCFWKQRLQRVRHPTLALGHLLWASLASIEGIILNPLKEKKGADMSPVRSK